MHRVVRVVLQNHASMILINFMEHVYISVTNMCLIVISIYIILLQTSLVWQVYTIPLDTCFTYDDCTSCTNSGDPLCGWCSVKNRCSRSVYCELAEQPGRWVQGGDSCVSAVALASETVAVDDLTQVSVSELGAVNYQQLQQCASHVMSRVVFPHQYFHLFNQQHSKWEFSLAFVTLLLSLCIGGSNDCSIYCKTPRCKHQRGVLLQFHKQSSGVLNFSAIL